MSTHSTHITEDAPGDPLKRIREMVAHAVHLLPSQSPLDFFVHHNTLHAFESLPFQEALKEASAQLGARSLMEESAYTEAFREGRIQLRDLDAVLGIAPETIQQGVGWKALATQPAWLQRLILIYDIQRPSEGSVTWKLFEQGELNAFPSSLEPLIRRRHIVQFQDQFSQLLEKKDESALRWFLTGTQEPQEALRRLTEYTRLRSFSPELLQSEMAFDVERLASTSLWLHCLQWAQDVCAEHPLPVAPFRRHRDRLLAETHEDLEDQVRPLLIRFFSHLLDQGVSYWPMPGRNKGILQAFVGLYGHRATVQSEWLRAAVKALSTHLQQNDSPEAIIEKTFASLKVEPAHQETYLTYVLFSLRGWMGMIQLLAERPELGHFHDISLSLLEAASLHLVLEASYLEHEASVSLLGRPWSELRINTLESGERVPASEAYRLFLLCMMAGVTTFELSVTSPEQRLSVWKQVEQFDGFSRCWVWHLAYERHYREEILSSVQQNARENRTLPTSKEPPSFQAIFCIDDREESFRRHLEEVEPTCETFGVAGFFGLDMNYQGALDAHPRSLCPANIRPKHIVFERPKTPGSSESADPANSWHKMKRRRRLLGWLQRHGFVGSRSLVRGLIWSLLSGVFSLIPMLMRVLAPRAAMRLEQRFKRYLVPPFETYTTFQREETPALKHEASEHADDDPVHSDLWVGYTHDELVARAQLILRFLGMTERFSPLVIFVGHGSTSLNNPHEAAYNCGACGGGRGGPNARIFAAILNLPNIRESLRKDANIDIPDETYFLGGFHDSASDALLFSDLDRVPSTHLALLEKVEAIMEEARQRNAHERCRRFESVPLHFSPLQALHHVEGRSHDLSEPRPEYNHCTNAICVVGRRILTRGLFLDRRAFLVSYDPLQDSEATILSGLLGSVGPVCAGINLEYYFSRVDNVCYGSGTKLPHNISGLLGVMNGFMSDLRTGLTWQMVEIHEPMRLLMIVEAPIERIQRALSLQPDFAQLVHNRWILLAAMEPDSLELQFFEEEGFVPWQAPSGSLPEALRSGHWYHGHRGHLAPARIASGVLRGNVMDSQPDSHRVSQVTERSM